MGFSVTAASVIVFVALLTAGSAAMSTYWESARETTHARDQWARMSESQVATRLTLSVNQCTSACKPPSAQVDLDITNAGTTVIDYRNLTYIIDGTAHTLANVTAASIVSPVAVSTTDLIIPGETMRVTIPNAPLTADYANDGSDLPIQVVTVDGVIGRR